jgi:hypothetical protein
LTDLDGNSADYNMNFEFVVYKEPSTEEIVEDLFEYEKVNEN